ncbi:alpha/beta hydrolase family protein [Paenibacillus lignilyticus]|uniref:Acetylxylan esterase n=1 Tax=Paenibacillus lignilyticus TaxID=1172615 RepID=A0ABS5CDE0_9BACL|nr:acetylxylan esterase [Paenibacillus lignilyticus]MBP3963999.1 acetylxylan esterase [Paenibacillus lignilyticus]
MRTYSLQEEQANRRRELSYIDDYPNIERFHGHPFRRYLDRLNADYLVKRKNALKQVNDREAASTYRHQVREAIRASVGPLPQAAASATVTGSLDQGSYSIDKVCFETVPGLFATGSFYYPKQRSGPLPALLLFNGHANEGKAYGSYVSFCVEAVMNGFCVLTFDPIGQGERRVPQAEGSDGGKWMDAVAAHCFLDEKLSLLGEHLGAHMMRDNIAALTYLLSRPEVDAERIGVTGNSGGGTMSAYMGAYDDRIKAVAPCCYITELRSLLYRIMAQDAEQCLPGFMARGLDHSDLVTAAAPKPYLIGAAMFDFFPIDGVRDAFIESKKLYRLLEAEEQLELHVTMKGHGFWHDMREQVLRFFCRVFEVDFVTEKGIDYERLPAEADLLCLAAGEASGGASFGGTMLSIIKERLHQLPIERQLQLPEVREQLRELLQLPVDSAVKCEPLVIDETGAVAFESEEGMPVTGSVHLFTDRLKPARVCLAVGGISGQGLEQAREAGYDAAFAIHPRGTGPAAMEPACTFGMFEPEKASGYNARMLGRSLQGMRVADVLAAISGLKRTPGYERAEITLYGQEEHALTALYAAVLSGDCHGLHAAGLLESFRAFAEAESHRYESGIIVPGLLLAFDIPDLLQVLEQEEDFIVARSWQDPMKNPLHGGITKQ